MIHKIRTGWEGSGNFPAGPARKCTAVSVSTSAEPPTIRRNRCTVPFYPILGKEYPHELRRRKKIYRNSHIYFQYDVIAAASGDSRLYRPADKASYRKIILIHRY